MYVDGFVLAVPTAKKEDYRAFSQEAWPRFKALGAQSMVECWGDDVPDGKLTSFPMAVQKKDDETVVFAWVVWPDKATREAANKKMMEDPSMRPENIPMPFDGKRMIYGGFTVLVQV